MTERERLAILYRDIFEVDNRGQAIYDDLYRRFGSSAKVHTDGGIDAVLKTYEDAAQRGVVEYIITMCNLGAGVGDEASTDEYRP